MPAWRLRDYHEADLDQAIQVWDQGRGPGSAEPVFSVAEVMAAARAGQPAVVAEVGDEVVGMAVAQLQGERAWIMLVAIGSRWRDRGVGSALLADLERRLRSQGVRRISAVLPESATGATALQNSGYTRRDGLVYYEMIEHLGLKVRDMRGVVVKSRGHFRAGFNDIFEDAQILEVDGPGLTTAILTRLPWTNLRRPIWPLDPDMAWSVPENVAVGR